MFYSSFHLLDVDCTLSIYMRERAVIDMYRVWPNICCVDICLVLRTFAPYSKQFVQTRCRWWRRDVFCARVPCNLLPTNTDYIYIYVLSKALSAMLRWSTNIVYIPHAFALCGIWQSCLSTQRMRGGECCCCCWPRRARENERVRVESGWSRRFIYKLEKTRRGAWNRWFAKRAARKLLDIRVQTTCWWLVWTVCQVAARWCSAVYIYNKRDSRDIGTKWCWGELASRSKNMYDNIILCRCRFALYFPINKFECAWSNVLQRNANISFMCIHIYKYLSLCGNMWKKSYIIWI